MQLNKFLDVKPEVAEAIAAGKPVVALESTIISHGMPYPQNVETALKVEQIIRECGAVPATIAIIGGRLKAGLSKEEIDYLGRTGAGKSTVFKLLLGLYPAESGTVTIGGVPVADITDRERRTCIGCVEQHFSRVPGTVLEQIMLGDPQITGEMARDAAALAGIDAAIRALPEGYNTVCTEGIFSQGEWQLLSIARAAAADPAVLLLDEITANLDAETEARVLEALRRASAGRTVLSVSHRVYENLGGRTIEIRTRE